MDMVKSVFSKKATKFDKIVTVDLTLFKFTLKIFSIFVAFLENINFITKIEKKSFKAL